MLHSNDHVLAFVSQQTFIATTRHVTGCLGQFFAIGFQFGQFLLQSLFASAQLCDLILDEVFYFGTGLSFAGDVFLRQLSLFHQFKFPIFYFPDIFFAGLDFMLQRPILFVFSRLKLLQGIFGNQLFLGRDLQFQVFAVNCAHLGCPVRWFPQSGLFMCPCHGGAYYRDGSRASGPPERGLFEYPYKVENGQITIQAGELPTPGPSAALSTRKPPCA